jgi:hypothetical protein
VSSGWGLLRVLRVSFGFFFGAFRRSLLYFRCNWVALNLRFFDIYNITYQKKKKKNVTQHNWIRKKVAGLNNVSY